MFPLNSVATGELLHVQLIRLVWELTVAIVTWPARRDEVDRPAS